MLLLRDGEDLRWGLMRKMRVSLGRIAATLGLVLAGPALHADPATAPTDCRALAAPAFEGGVDASDLRVADAISACQAEAQAEPEDGAILTFLARAYAKAEDWSGMRTALDAALATGAPEALWYAGVVHEFGYGGMPDPEAAAVYYRQSAEPHGFALAQGNLAYLYRDGNGVPQDQAAAQVLFEKAAAQGLSTAMHSAGEGYAFGFGVPVDTVRALDYFRRAADLGYAPSQLALAEAILDERGTDFDINEALHWMRAAADQGHAPAQSALLDLLSTVHHATSRSDFLEELSSRVAEIYESENAPPELVQKAIGVASTHAGMTTDEEDAAAMERALALYKAADRAADRSALELAEDVALNLVMAERYAEAEKLARETYANARSTDDRVAEYGALLRLRYVMERIGKKEELRWIEERQWQLNPQDIPNSVREMTKDEMREVSEILEELWDLPNDHPRGLKLYRRLLQIKIATAGPKHPSTASDWGSLGLQQQAAGKYQSSLRSYQAQADILAETLGSKHELHVAALGDLAEAQVLAGKISSGLATLERISTDLDATLGPTHPRSLEALNNLAHTYADVGTDVERVAVARRLHFERYASVAGKLDFRTANALWQAYVAIRDTGRTAEADAFFAESHARLVEASEARGIADIHDLEDMRNYASAISYMPGLSIYGEEVARQAVEAARALYGDNHVETAKGRVVLADVLDFVGRFREARLLIDAALATFRQSGIEDEGLVAALSLKSDYLLQDDKHSAAIEILRERLDVMRSQPDADQDQISSAEIDVARALVSKGDLSQAARIVDALRAQREDFRDAFVWPQIANIDAALAFLADDPKRAVRILDETFPGWDRPEHQPDLTDALRLRVLLAVGRNEDALDIARWALEAGGAAEDDIIARAALHETVRRGLANSQEYLGYSLARAAFARAEEVGLNTDEAEALLAEAFESAQPAGLSGASGSAAWAAARANAVRAGAGDAMDRWETAARALAALQETEARGSARAAATGDAFRDAWLTEVQQRRAEIENRLRQAEVELRRRAPFVFDALVPRRVSIDEIRSSSLLGDEDALIMMIGGNDDGGPAFVWAISAEDQAWARVPLSKDDLDERIAALRTDVDATFDLAGAHRLYADLFGDPAIRRVTGDKQVWRIVPTGSFLSLPFAALVTSPPAAMEDGADALREAAWLGTERGLSVLMDMDAGPDVPSDRPRSPGDRLFVGVGDPVFADAGAASVVPAASELFAGAIADRFALARLPRIPYTRLEVERMSQLLGSVQSKLLVGPDANEAALAYHAATGALNRADLILFATHGLVSGTFTGWSEPALALTPPADGPRSLGSETGTDRASLRRALAEGQWIDDGLLTASEIARLSLTADLVILSACDTAAGDSTGADGLSGLASSFLRAGARTLLVSHWPIEDRTAARVTTRLIAMSDQQPEMPMSLALSRVMEELIADTDRPLNAHPAIWAPFMLIETR